MKKILKILAGIGLGVAVAKLLKKKQRAMLHHQMNHAFKKSRKWLKGPYKKACKMAGNVQSKAKSIFS